jgi:FkbM family methyltransferase
MTQSLKHSLRSVVEATGHQIQKTDVYSSKKLRYRRLFSLLDLDLILDVGANSGQFAQQCRAAGYKGEIISFEPSSFAHARLHTAAAADALWTVADRVAVGEVDGETEINIAANSLSSSILPMLDSHLAASPESHYLHKETVSLRRLDSLLASIPKSIDRHSTGSTRRIFLKLDVQGYESRVLAGAVQTLEHTVVLQLEMSLLPLYEGQILMPQMYAEMVARGFDLWDLEPNFRDPSTGRLLEMDGVFTRRAPNLFDRLNHQRR